MTNADVGAEPIEVALSLGSNSGQRSQHLGEAIRSLQSKVTVRDVSNVYETKPVGYVDQGSFLNLALTGTTSESPAALLSYIKGVERRIGRRRTFRWGPRVIDIDILLYGQQIIAEPGLTIPHREMLSRAFVLLPLCEIAPNIRLPSGELVCAHLQSAAVQAQSVRRLGALSSLEA